MASWLSVGQDDRLEEFESMLLECRESAGGGGMDELQARARVHEGVREPWVMCEW